MFKFKYKRGLLWKTYIVEGFGPQPGDRLALHFKDGSILEIPEWSKCHCKLGRDFFDFQKKKMEQQAGQAIPLNVAK